MDVKDNSLPSKFEIILYPNSLFIISQFVNRIYNYKIIPSVLPIDKSLNSLEYIIRSSNCEVVYKNNNVFIKDSKKVY